MGNDILFPDARSSYDRFEDTEENMMFVKGLNPAHRIVQEAGSRRFHIEPLDPDKLIKVNDLKEVTNPTFFSGNNIPTPDGLLSNEIFGYSKEDRGNTFAYISLAEWFMHPLHYKIWCKVDSKIKSVIHEVDTFSIKGGKLTPDPEGKTGLKWLRENIDQIKFDLYESKQRDNIEFLKKFKDIMFIRNFIIIPAYYRDVNTTGGYVGVGEINQMYASLLIAVRGLRESKDYGLSLSGATRGRVQETLVNIYKWFADGSTSTGSKDGVGISGKYGILRRANLNKTADYSSRLVISAPNLRCENLEDMMVDTDHCALPLSSACVNFYPYMLHYVRSFFEKELGGNPRYDYIDKNGKVQSIKLKDYRIEYSDDRIKKEIDRFVHGYANRFVPIEIPNEEGKKIYMQFKGHLSTSEEFAKGDMDPSKNTMVERDLTWCDLLFIAANEVSSDKMVLITRYPMDSYYNQFPSKVRISSTKETESLIVDGKFYKWYPRIRQEDIGSHTSNKFIDTLSISNIFLAAIGGDYDGDQVSVKPIYTLEANAELEKHLDSKAHYISLGGSNVRVTTNEGIQTLYNLTIHMPNSNLGAPKFKK